MPRGSRSLAAGTLMAITVAGCGAGPGVGIAGRQADGVLRPKLATSPRASALPPGWNELRLPSGALLPYPPGWRPVSGDRGSASAALFDRDGTIRAYLNATPVDGHEKLAGWACFRLRHNAAEGDRNVRRITARTAIHRSAAGRTACVIDDYVTSRSRYRELACILASTNGRAAVVVVAAAQPDAWTREQPLLDVAVNHFSS